MRNFLLFALGLFSLAFIHACKEEGTQIAPTVTLATPTENQVFLKGQVITIAGTASDDGDLHEAEVKLTDKAGNVLLFRDQPTVHDETSHNFSYTFTVPDSLTVQHLYEVSATFYDHEDNETTKTVQVTAKPN